MLLILELNNIWYSKTMRWLGQREGDTLKWFIEYGVSLHGINLPRKRNWLNKNLDYIKYMTQIISRDTKTITVTTYIVKSDRYKDNILYKEYVDDSYSIVDAYLQTQDGQVIDDPILLEHIENTIWLNKNLY